MRIDSVTIENFGSFRGRHFVRLADRGIVFVAGINDDDPRATSNGAGKSTLFDALEWALFGEAPKGDDVNSVVNEQEGKNTCVTVRLTDDQAPLTVQRFRKLHGKSGARVWIGVWHEDSREEDAHRQQEATSLDAKETQRLIEGLLGLDREVFRAAVYRSQTETFNFADATDSERKEILTRILQLEELDDWLERARALATENTLKKEVIESQRISAEGELKVIAETDYAKQLYDWEEQREKNLVLLRNQYLEKKARSEALRASFAHLDEHKIQLHDLHESAPVEPAALRMTDAAVSQVATLGERNRQFQLEMKRLARQIDDFQSRGTGVCPTCGQEISAEHVEREIARLRSSLSNYEREIALIQEELARIDRSRQERDAKLLEIKHAYAEAVRAHAARARELELKIQEFGAKRYELEALEKELDDVYRAGVALKELENPFVRLQWDLGERRERLEAVLRGTEATFRGLEQRERLLDFWIHGLGPKGLKSYVLDARLVELNNAANQWVKVLTGGTVWVRFETQTMTKSTKALSEKFNVRVFRWNPDGTVIERNYRSWSGGEKAKVSLGIDFGLSCLVASRSEKPYDLLILDEVFRHLDNRGREAVFDLLGHLGQEKSSIFVVDHSDDLRGQFENVLTIRKRNGVSEVLAA